MVLNNLTNYVKTLALLAGGGYVGGNNSSGAYIDAPYTMLDTSGKEISKFLTTVTDGRNCTPFLQNNGLTLSLSQSSFSGTYVVLCLGTGTTPVTVNDYKLETIIDTNLSLYSNSRAQSAVVDGDNNKITKKITSIFSVKNTGTADIEVSEAGLFFQVYTSSSSNYSPVMMHREVFDSPVTIPAGSIRTFQFDFEFVNQM